jgi:hypothetical protein
MYFLIAIVLSHLSLIQCSVIPHCYSAQSFSSAIVLSHFSLLRCSSFHVCYNAQSFFVAIMLSHFSTATLLRHSSFATVLNHSLFAIVLSHSSLLQRSRSLSHFSKWLRGRTGVLSHFAKWLSRGAWGDLVGACRLGWGGSRACRTEPRGHVTQDRPTLVRHVGVH